MDKTTQHLCGLALFFTILGLALHNGKMAFDPSIFQIDARDRAFDRQLFSPDANADERPTPKPAPEYTGCFDLIDNPVPCENAR